MPNLVASLNSLTPPLRTWRSTLWTHLGSAPLLPGKSLPLVAAILPSSVTKSQLSVLGSRKTSMLWTLVVFSHFSTPALRAGRSRPVFQSGPLLGLRSEEHTCELQSLRHLV